jgi:uncharacterized membrane protein YdcZ (DUF606 family)
VAGFLLFFIVGGFILLFIYAIYQKSKDLARWLSDNWWKIVLGFMIVVFVISIFWNLGSKK